MKNPLFFNYHHGHPHPKREQFLPALKEAYQSLYDLVGAKKSDQFIFTSSGAEAVNHAVFAAYLDITRQMGKNHFIASNLDEAPALMAMNRLKQLGCVFQMASAGPNGYVPYEAIAETITPRTAMISLSWANALTGVIQPLAEIAKLCKERGILFHVDATHVLGKGAYTLESSGADLLSINGESLFGPSGSGGLFIREDLEISPMILGGEEQSQMRGGSFNIQNVIGLGRAARDAIDLSDHVCMETARLRSLFESLVMEQVRGARVLFAEEERLPHLSAFLFPGAASDALLYLLHQKGVFASAGGGDIQQMAPLLKACRIPEPLCYCGLSFAFSHMTTEEEIEEGARIVSETVIQVQKLSGQGS